MHSYPHFHKLMLITNMGSTPVREYLYFIKLCVEGGVTSVQLREKNTSYSFRMELASLLKDTLKPYNIPLIINDDPQLAKESGAAGVHLGQSDGEPEKAFHLLEENCIIGQSIELFDQIEKANSIPFLSYVTASAVFPTSHKDKLETFWGLQGVKKLSSHSTHLLTAIGGITLENSESVIQAGAKGIAVIGALHDAEDPKAAARALRIITG